MQLFKFFHTENTSNFKTQAENNGGFCEELLSENDFDAVLVNFCCYKYGANASEAVQKVSEGGVGWGASYNFFLNSPPKPMPPMGHPPLKNEARPSQKQSPPIET